jgi:hypothetical protein
VEWARQELVQKGIYALFTDVKKEVMEYPGEKILIVADKQQKYGENWIVCTTEAAREEQWAKLKAEEFAKEEAERKLREEAEAKRRAEEAIENAVYEDKPIIARPYTSDFVDKTMEEVDMLTVKAKRPLISLTISRPRREFQQPITLTSKEADESAVMRSHKDPNFDLTRKELDKAIQAVPELADNMSQTTWYRKVNRITQYEDAGDDAHDKVPLVEDPIELVEFLRNARPLMEVALQQNETLDIFMDEFALLGDEDMALGNKAENHIKVIRTFADLEYSKNKSLPAIDWHPKSLNIVAVSAVSNDTFDQRVEKSGSISSRLKCMLVISLCVLPSSSLFFCAPTIFPLSPPFIPTIQRTSVYVISADLEFHGPYPSTAHAGISSRHICLPIQSYDAIYYCRRVYFWASYPVEHSRSRGAFEQKEQEGALLPQKCLRLNLARVLYE